MLCDIINDAFTNTTNNTNNTLMENQLIEEFQIQSTDSDKGFLKGAAAAGTLAAILGSPESAQHAHELLNDVGDNIHHFVGNIEGSGDTHGAVQNAHQAAQGAAQAQPDVFSRLEKQGFKNIDGVWVNQGNEQAAEIDGNNFKKVRLGDILNRYTPEEQAKLVGHGAHANATWLGLGDDMVVTDNGKYFDPSKNSFQDMDFGDRLKSGNLNSLDYTIGGTGIGTAFAAKPVYNHIKRSNDLISKGKMYEELKNSGKI